MIPIDTPSALEEALDAPRALVYKHSPRCGLSFLARREIRRFEEKFPDATVYVIDVVARKDLSETVAARLGVRHESPQALLVERGRARAHASHRGVRSTDLSRWWLDSVDRR